MSELLQFYVKSQPDVLTRKLEGLGATAEMIPSLINLIAETLPNSLKGKKAELSQAMEDLLGPLQPRVAEIARNGHIKALERDFLHNERTRSHQAMNFSIQKASSKNLVLPDTGASFLIDSHVRPLSQKGDRIEQVLIPIDSATLIVGWWKDPFIRPTSVVNKILASCAFETFATRDIRPEFSALARKIGKNTTMITDAEIGKIMRDFDLKEAFVQQA